MSQNLSEKESILSLYQLCNGLKQYLDRRLKYKRLWVVAEISNLKYHSAGHVYMDLVEMRDGQTIAKLQATIWKTNIEVLKQKLGPDIDNVLDNGNKVLFNVSVTFHEVYGMKLDVQDLDINYTLGELEKKRQMTIELLKKDHLLDKNKSIELPMVIQKFVLIAAEGSSGYKDFINQITNNSSGYKFDFVLLNTLVQGERAEEEIIKRLRQADRIEEIDAVLILRGGGSKLDLEVFNSYDLCHVIANHKKPVLTGIGHETDLCVADLVAHSYLNTPTALAEFLHQRAKQFESRVIENAHDICRSITSSVHIQRQKLLEYEKDIKNLSSIKFERQKDVFRRTAKAVKDVKKELYRKTDAINSVVRNISEKIATKQSKHKIELHNFEAKVKSNSKLKIQSSNSHLRSLSKLLFNLHPERLIERGFATVSMNETILRKGTKLKIGDVITVHVYDKEITCEVIKINDQWTLNLMNKLLKSWSK